MQKSAYLLAIILLLLTSCATHKPVSDSSQEQNSSATKQTETITSIQFGSGGGFSGAVSTNTLYTDGRLLDSQDHTKTISERLVADAFAMAAKAGKPYMNPGNMYLFIRIYRGEEFSYYAWQMGDSNVPAEITNLYNQLIGLL